MKRSKGARAGRAASAQLRSRRAAPAPAPAGRDAGERHGLAPAWDRRTWLVVPLLGLITFAAFVPVLDNGFVDWDDTPNFVNNPNYRGLGIARIKWAWGTFWLGVYQPLAWLLFEVQYVSFNLDPRGYHLISLILHAVDAVVLYLLIMTLLVRCRTDPRLESPWACCLGAALATALFAVHPLRVEAVAWASCQPYLPCALFSMLSVLAYLRAFGTGTSPRRGWLAASFVLFAAALLCKAVAVTLPAVLLILDVYPLRRLGGGPGRWFGPSARGVWYEKVPFFLLSLVFMWLAVAAKDHAGTLVAIEDSTASSRAAQACYGVWFYIFRTAVPLDINAFYPLPGRIDWLAPPFLLSILGTLATTAVLFLLRRRWPGWLAAWLSYVVILAPSSGLVRIGGQLAADRYSYMALLGGVVLAAAGLRRLWQPSSRARPVAVATVAVGLGALLGLGFLTWDQCRTWRTSETLWNHALKHGAAGSSQVHNNLGVALSQQGKLAEAAAEYAEAIRLDPGYVRAYDNWGGLLFRQGKFAEAGAQYTEAIRLRPQDALLHNGLGAALAGQGKLAEAAAEYAEAIRLDPGYAEAHNNLGSVFFRRGRFDEAAAEYAEAIRLRHDLPQAHNNLGVILSRRGRFGEAAAEYAEAIRLDPGYVEAHDNLGSVYFSQGKLAEAAAEYTEALRLDPGYTKARNSLRSVLSRERSR